MLISLRSVRKAAAGAIGAGALTGAMLFSGSPAAQAAPLPAPGTTFAMHGGAGGGWGGGGHAGGVSGGRGGGGHITNSRTLSWGGGRGGHVGGWGRGGGAYGGFGNRGYDRGIGNRGFDRGMHRGYGFGHDGFPFRWWW
jgi:hypothetical protein